jgi:uncharacterized protein
LSSPRENLKPWYDKGLRFECQRCGRCCTNRGPYTFVFLTPLDVSALADNLGLTESEFRARHCREHEGRTTLRTDLPRCEFQSQDGGCTVYAARPEQCKSWPFWRENLVRETWEREVVPLCPGVGKGRLHSSAEIEAIARHDEEWYAE